MGAPRATFAVFLMLGGVPAFAELPDDLPACTLVGQSPPCWVLPSDTDGDAGMDCYAVPPSEDAIGCENLWPGEDDDALNKEHYLYLPPSWTEGGKLLVFFGGGNGSARACEEVCPIAAQQGYHVIALTYPAAGANRPCAEDDLTAQEKRDCYGNAFHEVVTGVDLSPAPGSGVSTLSDHKQDTIVNRLSRVLTWAHGRYPGDGWGQYVNLTTGEVDWTRVHLAGHSNGTSHGGFMGTLPEFQGIGRVALFAGPDDGEGGTTEAEWNPATYVQEGNAGADTGTRYYGLVHVLNKARNLNTGEIVDPAPIYQVLKNWQTFGMDWPNNSGRFDEYNPQPGDTPDFGDAHMLISTDPERAHATDPPVGTTKGESHASVIKDVYCTEEDAVYDCVTHGTTKIGYEPAWRCILGSGDACVSSPPVAHAGPDQTVECQGGGGATVTLDGSGSRDADCDVLTYAWSGALGQASGRKPAVFAPLGSSTAMLEVKDPWSSSPACPTASAPDSTLITVIDTQPPSLQVTLTPTLLWPPDHRMVAINAAVSVADTCGGTPPTVVLTSVTSDQPDNGVADGDTVNDIQGANLETFDTTFLLRAERAGNVPSGRTYTVKYTATDASGNHTQASATVHVPHSQ